jgi:two-component system sensor histidine kinase TctE
MSRTTVRSLRYLYLKGMLQVLLPTLVIGITVSYLYASHSVRDIYDLDLLDDANDLFNQVEVHQSGNLSLDLPLAARQMLLANNEESVVYAVWDSGGHLMSGSQQLSKLAGEMPHHSIQQYDTVLFSGHNYRMIWRQEAIDQHPFFIAVAETSTAIDKLLLRVIAGFIFLGALLILIAVLGILVGVRQSLVPIDALRAAIARRSPNDFSHFPEATAPEELQPIIHGINELLQKLEKSVLVHRRFVADAAHQLRTPLAVLTSKLETALVIPENRNNPLLLQLLTVTQRTSHLAHQLLSLSRIENAGIMDANLKPIDLEDVVREIAAGFVIPAEHRHIQLDFELESCMVRGDRLLLQEVVSNLLDNAFRYSGEDSHVQVTLHGVSGFAELCIADNGVGVSLDELQKLGQPFFRAHATDSEGCGLGLAIVNEIIQVHKGQVRYTTTEGGQGLSVLISLPIAVL